MQINFYPEYDNPEFEKAAKKYGKIWEEEGDKIIEVIEKISGLKFKEKIINAITYKYGSWAYPLSLQVDLPPKFKKCSIIHELCHRLVRGNNFETKKYTIKNTHKQIDLILFDILSTLYGEEIAKEEIEFEISLWTGKGISPYKIAWDWALSMTKEERQKLWKKSLRK
jgi:hypothetical protein